MKHTHVPTLRHATPSECVDLVFFFFSVFFFNVVTSGVSCDLVVGLE